MIGKIPPPKIDIDIVAERNRRVRFAIKSLLALGVEVDSESIHSLHTLSPSEQLDLKVDIFEDQLAQLYRGFRCIFLKLFLLNHMHFLKNMQSFLVKNEGFKLEANKDVYAVVALAHHIRNFEEKLK